MTDDRTHGLQVEHPDVVSLRTYYRNARQGDVGQISISLRVNGQYRPIVVNRGTHTGRPNEVLAGNHTLMGARELGWPTIAAVYVDVDDDAATRIVLADNRTADLGTYDDRALTVMLRDLGGELEGTGFGGDDLDDLLRNLEAGLNLDDLAVTEDIGPTDSWPTIAFRCPPAVHGKFLDLVNDEHDGDYADALASLLGVEA